MAKRVPMLSGLLMLIVGWLRTRLCQLGGYFPAYQRSCRSVAGGLTKDRRPAFGNGRVYATGGANLFDLA